MEALAAAGYLIVAYLVGSIPYSQLMVRATSGADLRRVSTGTVSGTGVFEVSGFWPVAGAGLLDILKGVVVVAPVAGAYPMLAAFGAGAAAAGHNWSIFLRGAGGRAMSVAGGATIGLHAWWGLLTLGLGLGLGRLIRKTGFVSFLAEAALPAVLAATEGAEGAVMGSLLTGVMLAKRLAGNCRPERRGPAVYFSRLLLDNDSGFSSSGRPAV